MRIPKLRFLRIKWIFFTVILLVVYMIISYFFNKIWKNRTVINKFAEILVELNKVIVHIDLKGTPVKLSYLQSLLPLIKNLGANGILLEYDDMFPYEGNLANLSAEYCYDKSELKNFLSAATNMGFEVIPLIQTFGHLEYALKLEEFQHLREDHQYPDSICPSKSGSKDFLWNMIEQVVDLHNTVSTPRYIHVGCDEVFHLNICNDCKIRKLSNKNIFLNHLTLVSGMVHSISADIVVLFWDDMLRNIKPIDWRNIEQFTNVHPVYWDYTANLKVNHRSLYEYHQKFDRIWIASAYKGADGRMSVFPNITHRFLNHLSWMNTIVDYTFGGENDIYDFKGIILTGWSRYSHMDPPCDLLPVSIPSLILCLLVIKEFKTGIIKDYSADYNNTVDNVFDRHINLAYNKSLNCLMNLDNFDSTKCDFEGKELYRILKQYILINNEIALGLYNDENPIATIEYYSNLRSINMNNILEYRNLLNVSLHKIMQMEDGIFVEMSKYYHKSFFSEYVGHKSFQTKRTIMSLLKVLHDYSHTRTWKRRSKRNLLRQTDTREFYSEIKSNRREYL